MWKHSGTSKIQEFVIALHPKYHENLQTLKINETRGKIVIHDDSGTSITKNAKSWQSIFWKKKKKLHKNTHVLLRKSQEYSTRFKMHYLCAIFGCLSGFIQGRLGRFHPRSVGFSAGDKEYMKRSENQFWVLPLQWLKLWPCAYSFVDVITVVHLIVRISFNQLLSEKTLKRILCLSQY